MAWVSVPVRTHTWSNPLSYCKGASSRRYSPFLLRVLLSLLSGVPLRITTPFSLRAITHKRPAFPAKHPKLKIFLPGSFAFKPFLSRDKWYLHFPWRARWWDSSHHHCTTLSLAILSERQGTAVQWEFSLGAELLGITSCCTWTGSPSRPPPHSPPTTKKELKDRSPQGTTKPSIPYACFTHEKIKTGEEEGFAKMSHLRPGYPRGLP